MARAWTGDGPDREHAWGGRTWTLALARDGSNPGLRARLGTREIGPLLGLAGYARLGQGVPGVFRKETLRSFSHRDDQVEAVYALDELIVQGTWRMVDGDVEAVDLVVEVEAKSSLPAFELLVESVLPEPVGSRPRRWVESRDVAAAALSYDGREGDAANLTTLPPAHGEVLQPRVVPSPWDDGLTYVEMIRGGEVARRITESRRISSVGHTTRYGLFGRDLAPGATCRATLRGVWLLSSSPQNEAIDLARAFAL